MADHRRTIRDGVIIGLMGYGAVALFYGTFDFLASRGALYTVNLLGRAVFRGVRDPSILEFPVDFDTGAMVAYNALHLGLALAIGLIVAGLVSRAERRPDQRAMVRAIIVSGFVVTVAAVGLFTTPMRALLPWWSIVVANAAATVLAGTYLLALHPGLWGRLALGRA